MKKTAASQHTSRRSRQSFRLVVVLLALIGLLVALSYNRQGIQDFIRLRGYQAPAAVAAIAAKDTLTTQGRRIFYVNQPNIADKASFASQCPSGNEQTVVLGCYHGNQDGIYVLAVNDSRLSGIEEVTSAHELLHAAYDRLDSRQKRQIDTQLTDYFDHGLKDNLIRAQINGYKKSEPDQLVNEMHSILGTEVPHLPPALETYYKRYFTDRSAITQQYANYENEFTSRQAAIKNDDTRLAALKSQIVVAEASLKDQADTLQARERQLNSLRAGGDIAGYNSQVPGYNLQVDSYNAQVAATKQLVNQYNQLVDARNAIALETQQLTDEITSSVAPISQ